MAIYHVGDVKKHRFTIKKDSVAWTTLTSVTLKFIRSDGTTFNKTCVLESSNIWYYVTVAADYNISGTWDLYLIMTDGITPETYGPITISVQSP